MKFLAAALLSVLVAPTTVLAASPGWEFARWGMTPAEVRAASHGSVRAGESSGYDTLDGEYPMGRFKFAVVFNYEPHPDDPGNSSESNLRLGGVGMKLDLKSGACAQLGAYLTRRLGHPDHATTEGPPAYKWRKQDLGDEIDYTSWPDGSCGIQYSPIGSS